MVPSRHRVFGPFDRQQLIVVDRPNPRLVANMVTFRTRIVRIRAWSIMPRFFVGKSGISERRIGGIWLRSRCSSRLLFSWDPVCIRCSRRLSLASQPEITLSPVALPAYALRTTMRMPAALAASLIFTFTYANPGRQESKSGNGIDPTPRCAPVGSGSWLSFIHCLSSLYRFFPAAFWGQSLPRFSRFSPVKPGTWPSASFRPCAHPVRAR